MRDAPDLDIEAFASGYFPPSYSEADIPVCGDLLVPRISEVESEWYPGQWSAACEPSFWQLSEAPTHPDFALRFSLIPSFEPSVFIQVFSSGESHRLIVKEMSGAGGYEPGYIWRSRERVLTTVQVSELKRMIESERFFGPTAIDPDDGVLEDGCSFGFDGSQWIFERVDENGYAMVQHWSPNEGAAKELGEYLIDLTGWEF